VVRRTGRHDGESYSAAIQHSPFEPPHLKTQFITDTVELLHPHDRHNGAFTPVMSSPMSFAWPETDASARRIPRSVAHRVRLREHHRLDLALPSRRGPRRCASRRNTKLAHRCDDAGHQGKIWRTLAGSLKID
jgi:hypothetical protein